MKKIIIMQNFSAQDKELAAEDVKNWVRQNCILEKGAMLNVDTFFNHYLADRRGSRIIYGPHGFSDLLIDETEKLVKKRDPNYIVAMITGVLTEPYEHALPSLNAEGVLTVVYVGLTLKKLIKELIVPFKPIGDLKTAVPIYIPLEEIRGTNE